MDRQANLALHIEQLILHDLPYSQRSRVAVAIEAELTRLLTERGIPEGWSGDMPPINAGPVHVSPHLSAETIGRQVAETVYAGFAGAARSTAPAGDRAGSGQGMSTAHPSGENH